MSSVTEVMCWEATDGRLFKSQESAQRHQTTLDDAVAANVVLHANGSIGDALRAVDYIGEIDAVLNRVTMHTKLVISHWQCQDTPGYSPVHFEPGLSMYVYGNAGSWTGSYGNSVSLRDLVRYANDKRTDFGDVTPNRGPAAGD